MPRCLKFAVLGLGMTSLLAQAPPPAAPANARLPYSIVYTRIPVHTPHETTRPVIGGTLRTGYGEGGRIVLRSPGGSERVLTEAFQSAADPEVSFDGKRILFAAKRAANDRWNIFEMNADGSGVRQVTRDLGDCRSPLYVSAIFYLNDPAPVHQIAFVTDFAGELSEHGGAPTSNLYTVRPDGSGARRLTYAPSASFDPTMLPDGRVLYSTWTWRGSRPVLELFGIHNDGADTATFSGFQGARVKHMAAVTPKRQVIFVDADEIAWDAAGALASVTLRRNLKSYRRLTTPQQGLFHSPSPLPDGTVLVSRRIGAGTHGIYRFNPETGRISIVQDLPGVHEVQARALLPRQEPDGHSSVVEDDATFSKLYCLSVYDSDLGRDVFQKGMAKRLRVLEGVPRTKANANAKIDTLSSVLQRRFLGEIDIAEDGSFQVEVPPNIPIQLQVLDEHGMALRSTAWIWAKNKEQRGCIGCHEDRERTPENVMATALLHPAPKLTLPPDRRRTIDFDRDVAPLIRDKCAACHAGPTAPRLAGNPRAVYGALHKLVTPGRARTSPLVWSLYGRNTSRPWDSVAGAPHAKPMPPAGSPQFTEDDKRTIIEWIDLGAHFNGLPTSPVEQAAQQ